jgi:hypothetical protein
MSNTISFNKKNIKMLTSICTPKIHLDFTYLKPWTTIASISYLISQIVLELVRKNPSSGALGIKDPS